MSSGLLVKNLVKGYGAVTAVDDVSFEVEAGEFVSLLGPSGCGKTTTLRCIAGFEQPEGGQILVNGAPIVDAARGIFLPPNRRHFGMVFQSYAVWPHKTVFANVAYPLQVQGGISRADIRARTFEKLQAVGLTGLEERYPNQLSGGQQQRVALARALVMDPKVLLFDEPLSNLDAKLRERMRFELIAIQSTLGIPAVYVTHDQAEAMVMSRRIIVMDGGKVAQAGPPEDIYDRPASRFVADFIGLSNFIESEIISRSSGKFWRVRSEIGDFDCMSSGDHDPGEKVLVVIRPEHLELLSGSKKPQSNVVSGTLVGHYFLGPHSELFFQVNGGELRMQSSLSISAKVGDVLNLKLPPERCRVIRES